MVGDDAGKEMRSENRMKGSCEVRIRESRGWVGEGAGVVGMMGWRLRVDALKEYKTGVRGAHKRWLKEEEKRAEGVKGDTKAAHYQ